MRIFAISDLHTDFKPNWALVEGLSERLYRNDALIVAGDIADNLERIRSTLGTLRSKFARVFYTPGNHELWVRGEGFNSVEKLLRILWLCRDLGVETAPARVGGRWVVPLFSWYTPELARAEEIDDEELLAWADFQFCKWPADVGELSDYFLKMNESNIRGYDGPVVSFSHFLPRRDLLPPLKYLRFRGLPKVAGSPALDRQIRRLGSAVHVFGHSHINCDKVIDKVRYVQNALSYPRERSFTELPIKLISS
jgi:predicted phosphodiesterase